jgi:hypothetical protein
MEEIKVIGVLKLKYYNKGILVKEILGKNMIVNSGYNAILGSLSGSTTGGIDKVQIGTSITMPSLDDTVITNPVDIIITNKTITSGTIGFDFQFGADQGNGTTFNEFGLILTDGTLFARKHWEPIVKIQDLSINGTWEIKLF